MSDRGGELTRDILLRVKAENLSNASFRQAADAVKQLTAALDAQVAAAARGDVKEKELTETLNKLQQAAKNFSSTAGQIEIFKDFAPRIRDAEASLGAVSQKLDEFYAKNGTGALATRKLQNDLQRLQTTYGETYVRIESLLQQQTKYGERLAQNGIDVNNLATAEQHLKDAADQAGSSIRTLTEFKADYARITRETAVAVKAQAEAEKLAAAAEAARAEQIGRVTAALQAAANARRTAEYGARVAPDVDRINIENDRAKAQAEVSRGAAQAREEARARNGEIARRDVEENLRVRKEAVDRERAIDADRAKAQAEVSRGASTVNNATVRRGIEENLRLRQEEVDKEREIQRRGSLGFFGRLREDAATQRQMYKDAQARRLTDEQAAAEAAEHKAQQRRNAQKGQTGLFGLPSYQVTNLGYQATDVFQGVVGGVNPATILAQQGPQIFQIFGLAALKWLPVIAVAAAATTVAIETLNKSLQETKSNREFEAAIQANANALNYDAKTLTEYRKDIEGMAVSWKDAGQVIRTAMSANIGQDRIRALAQTAKDVSRVTGEEVPDAMKRLVAGFTGGQKGIRDLNESLNFLDEAGTKHVETLYKQGKGAEAVEFALDKLAKQYRKAGEAATSPFQRAVESLEKSWNELLRTLADSESIEKAIGAMTRLVNLIDRAVQSVDAYYERQKNRPQPVITDEEREKEYYRNALEVGNLEPPPSLKGKYSGVTPVPKAGAGDTRVSANFPVTTDEQRDLLAAIQEYSKSLPEGMTIQVQDPSGHSKFVKGTNKISEHYLGRAFDVKVLQDGETVPGYMGRGGPAYTELEQGVAKIIAERKQGPIALGSTFPSKPDAGHMSLRGPEAEGNEFTRGLPAVRDQQLQEKATTKQRQDAEEGLRISKQAYDVEQARSREEELRLKRAEITRQVQNEFPGETPDQQARQQRIIDMRVEAVALKQRIDLKKEELTLERNALQQRQHPAEAEAARQKAIADALARNITNYKELKTIGDTAAATEESRLTAIDQENEKVKGLEKALRDMRRETESPYKTDLDRQLDAIDQKIKNVREQFVRVRRENVLTGPSRLDDLEKQIEPLQAQMQFSARRAAAEASGKEALQARQALIQSYEKAYDTGEITLEEKIKKTEEATKLVTPALLAAADALDKWVEAGKKVGNIPALELEKATAAAQQFRGETKYMDPFFTGLRDTIKDSFGTNMTEAFDTISEALGKAIVKTGEWKDVWLSLGTASSSFFSGLLKDVAGYLIKKEATRLLESAGIGDLFGLGQSVAQTANTTAVTANTAAVIANTAAVTAGAAASATSAGASAASAGVSAATVASMAVAVAHEGGIVGQTQLPRRGVPGSWFDRAPRYHTGAVVGLAANEQTAILQRGEEVLAANSPRHARNWSGGAAPDINIRNVLVADPELVPAHMASSRGEKVIMNTLTRNAATVRQLVR